MSKSERIVRGLELPADRPLARPSKNHAGLTSFDLSSSIIPSGEGGIGASMPPGRRPVITGEKGGRARRKAFRGKRVVSKIRRFYGKVIPAFSRPENARDDRLELRNANGDEKNSRRKFRGACRVLRRSRIEGLKSVKRA